VINVLICVPGFYPSLRSPRTAHNTDVYLLRAVATPFWHRSAGIAASMHIGSTCVKTVTARVVQCSLFCPNASYFYISTPCSAKSATPLLSTRSPKSYAPHNRFMAIFLEPSGWAGARRELLDFMVQGKINTGRHTDHPAVCHSIRTKQCPPPPSPPFSLQAGCPSCRPRPNQQCQSTEGNYSKKLARTHNDFRL